MPRDDLWGVPQDGRYVLDRRSGEQEFDRARVTEAVRMAVLHVSELENARKHGVGLQLSGHTHGGQFWPWTLVVAMIQPVVRGLARFGETQVYVNTGTGYWGPPLRTGNAPEITLVRLRAPSLDRAP